MDRVSLAEFSKYKYYIYQLGTSFCNTTPGLTTRREMSQLRRMVKEQASTEIIFGSRRANRIFGRRRDNYQPIKEGNFFDTSNNTINLVSGSRNQPRGMVMEEIQHALDNATDPNLNRISDNYRLHAGTFERMANNPDLRLTPQERNRLLEQARRWRER